MKGFAKKLQGSLKLARLGLPFVLVPAALGILVGVPVVASINTDKLYDEIRNTEIVQEIIDQEKDRVEQAYQDGTMTMENYYDSQDYLNSNDFIDDVVKNNTQLKDYGDDLQKTSLSFLYFMLFAVPALPGVIEFINLYTGIFEDDGEKGYKRVIKSAKEDFKEAKEINKLKRENKEINEYKEEIL